MRFQRRNNCVAPVSKDGAAPWFETPRTRLIYWGRPNIAAPHHEAERDRAWTFRKKDLKGAVAAPFGFDSATAQSIFQAEKITLGTAGSPAGFL